MSTDNIFKYYYEQSKNTPSDINEHIEVLYEYAKGSNSILECGVRSGVSTWAFAYGLLNNDSDIKKLVSCDLQKDPSFELRELILKLNLDFKFWIGNDLNYPDNEKFDIIFIDTWHIYGQLKRELAKFASMCNKWIIMHDTTVDGIYGETIRNGWNAHLQSIETGFPIDEINKGLWPAVTEFLNENKNYELHQRYIHCNGLTVLKKIN